MTRCQSSPVDVAVTGQNRMSIWSRQVRAQTPPERPKRKGHTNKTGPEFHSSRQRVRFQAYHQLRGEL